MKGRKWVVPSAPGKGESWPRKITDLLLLCHDHARQNLPFEEVWQPIENRFETLVRELGSKLDLATELGDIKKAIAQGASPDFAASRGEYLGGKLLAEFLGAEFIDAASVIRFDGSGDLDLEESKRLLSKRCSGPGRFVVPGFYGSDREDKIRVFSRGGSDITGSVLAAALSADAYENWTDVSGLLMADPRVVEHPLPIEVIGFRELRELSYMGAVVFHDEALFPLRGTSIPVHIRNVNAPEDPGTRIERNAAGSDRFFGVRGIAGRKDFTVIAMEKALMNQERGFGRRVLRVLEDHGVSYEHSPTGIDTMSLVVSDQELEGKLEPVVEGLRRVVKPDHLQVFPRMALIAVVGRGMAHRPGVASRLFEALAKEEINVRMIDQGSSEINIILGVDSPDFEGAVRAIYQAFVGSTTSTG